MLKAVSFDDTGRVRDTCLCLHTQRAARVLARRFDEAFRPLGLTSGQFSLLMSLNRPEPPAMGAVAELLAVDRTTLTAAVKPLARRGLLNIMVAPGDARGRLLALTGAGRRLLAQAFPVWISTHAAIEAPFPAGSAARVRSDLSRLGSKPRAGAGGDSAMQKGQSSRENR